MAKKDEAKKLRRESRKTARKTLNDLEGFPIAPRKAMSQAKKNSKNLSYPLPPYTGANPFTLFRWAAAEWDQLGKWKGFVLPFVILTALRTWEKERAQLEEYETQLEQRAIRRENAKLYGTFGQPKKARKLLGIIPLPGGK